MDQAILNGIHDKGQVSAGTGDVSVDITETHAVFNTGRYQSDPNRVKFNINDQIEYWGLFWGLKSPPSPLFDLLSLGLSHSLILNLFLTLSLVIKVPN